MQGSRPSRLFLLQTSHRTTSKKKTNMQPKTAPDQLDIKTARSVLRAKLLSAIEMQRADRKQERAYLDYAAQLAHMVADDARREDARGKANVLHNTRIVRRPALRYLAVAYAFALGRPYAAQEAKAAIPLCGWGLADVLLDTQPSVNSTMKRAVREDIEAWLKGDPTAAQREALALAEAAIEAGVFEAAQ